MDIRENVKNGVGCQEMRKKIKEKEKEFIKCYLGGDTMGNASRSYEKAYGVKKECADASGCKVLKRPIVIQTMKDMLNETGIGDGVRTGLQMIVDGFLKANPEVVVAKEFLEAARLITEIRGDKSPDKQIVMHVTPEDREKEYEDIVDRVLKVKKHTVEAPETPLFDGSTPPFSPISDPIEEVGREASEEGVEDNPKTKEV